MAVLDSAGGNGLGKDGRTERGGAAHSGAAKLVRMAAVGASAGAALLFLGFFLFLSRLERRDEQVSHKADAIVVLTGGAERIADAVGLLRGGGGQRLLISGVANEVTSDAIAAKAPALRGYVKCCVDLGHAALNTAGNAKEARHWVARHGYRSLVVVTSSYHMPRALVELRRQMPDIALVPAPVVTDKLRELDFVKHPELLKTVSAEYLKFLYAWVRAGLTTPRTMDEINAANTRRRV